MGFAETTGDTEQGYCDVLRRKRREVRKAVSDRSAAKQRRGRLDDNSIMLFETGHVL